MFRRNRGEELIGNCWINMHLFANTALLNKRNMGVLSARRATKWCIAMRRIPNGTRVPL
jgi:hypothetical protein